MTPFLAILVLLLFFLDQDVLFERVSSRQAWLDLRPFLRLFFFFSWAYLYWISGILGFFLGSASTSLIWMVIILLGLLYLGRGERVSWTLKSMESLLVFLSGFFLILILRGLFPDLHQTEKFTDLMFLQSCLQAGSFPPEDLWLSGETLNYYYFGYLLFAPLMKLLSTSPEVAYQISFSLVGGLTAEVLFGLGRLLKVSRRGAAFATALLLLGGNLEWIRQMPFYRFSQFNWWAPSRVFQGAINEFPSWSFLLGDLHPHVISLSMALAFMGTQEILRDRFSSYSNSGKVFVAVFLALLIGVFYPMHPWSLPLLALFFAWRWRREFLWVGLIALLSVFFYLPFWLSYEGPITHYGWVPLGLRSTFGEVFLHWGLFLISLFWLLPRSFFLERKWIIATVPVLILMAIFLGGASTLYFFLLVWSIWDLRKKNSFSRVLISLSLFLLLLCENFYLGGVHGKEMLRFNTVFKTYFLIWPLLGIGLASRFSEEISRSSQKGRRAGHLIILLTTILALVFPVFGIGNRALSRPASWTLEGRGFLERSHPGESEAIGFLRENARPGEVVLEAIGPAYKAFGRFATFSGLPTPMAWQNHQSVWRRDGWHRAEARKKDILEVMANPSLALPILREKYGVRWIADGYLEKSFYSSEFRKYLRENLTLRFQEKGVFIYEWIDSPTS